MRWVETQVHVAMLQHPCAETRPWRQPPAASTRAMPPAPTRSSPTLGWDLTLYPKQLHAAYWRDRSGRYIQWDMQVVGSLLIVLTFSICRHAVTSQTTLQPSVWASIPAWLVLAVWLLVAVRRPNAYREHRTPLVLAFKSLLALAVVTLTNEGARLVALGRLEPSSPRLLIQAVALHGLVHLPALCVGLPLPFWLQLGWVLARTAAFCLGGASRDLVALANQPAFLKGLSAFNLLWTRLVQSGNSHTVVAADAALQDHSTAMAVALVTMHLSAAAVSMYLAYISQWVQVRAWLKDKASRSPQQQQQQQQQQQRQQQPPQSQQEQGPPACPTDIGGVLVTPQQLQDMGRSHAARLLLDGRGVLGRASMACFHAGAVNTILLVVLLLSHVLVLRVGPRVLSGPVLRAFYPLRPELEGGVCRPEDELQLGGFWGSLLAALAA